MIYGIDVSNWQGTVNWTAVKRAGYKFASIKATEGNYYEDPYFPDSWHNARRNGLIVGAYHFLRPEASGIEQADYLHSYVRKHGRFHLGDFVVVDLEVSDNQASGSIFYCLDQFIKRARYSIDKPVFLYTGRWFWEEIGSPYPVDSVKDCPLWIASYPNSGIPDKNDIPLPFEGWNVTSFWQYSQNGRVPGVNGDCDLNVFLGDHSQLEKILRTLPDK